jgi:hypothetical protein
VADRRDPIDLRTLEEVHRLLSSSDFATADDVEARRGRERLAAARSSGAATATFEPSPTPLPRRRR